jgi:hypothetical protein
MPFYQSWPLPWCSKSSCHTCAESYHALHSYGAAVTLWGGRPCAMHCLVQDYVENIAWLESVNMLWVLILGGGVWRLRRLIVLQTDVAGASAWKCLRRIRRYGVTRRTRSPTERSRSPNVGHIGVYFPMVTCSELGRASHNAGHYLEAYRHF